VVKILLTHKILFRIFLTVKKEVLINYFFI
jgi:hypothetical protein